MECNYRKQLQKTKSSDTVWWLWLQGEEKAPPVCKACLASVRRFLPEKKVIVLTEQNLWDYVDFPDYIKDKYRCGLISKTHFSDLMRLQLLITHGGLWVDSTVYLTGRPDFAFGLPLFVFSSSQRTEPTSCGYLSNWFISAEKENPILSLTRDLLFDYWKKHNKIYHYFIFHFFFTMVAKKLSDEWDKVPFFFNITPHIMQHEMLKPFSEKRFEYLKTVSPVHKLTYKYDETQDISGTILEYIIKSMDFPV